MEYLVGAAAASLLWFAAWAITIMSRHRSDPERQNNVAYRRYVKRFHAASDDAERQAATDDYEADLARIRATIED